MPLCELPKNLHSPHYLDSSPEPPHGYNRGGRRGDRSQPPTEQRESASWRWDVFGAWLSVCPLDSVAGASPHLSRWRPPSFEHVSPRLLYGQRSYSAPCPWRLFSGEPSGIPHCVLSVAVQLQQCAAPPTFDDLSSLGLRSPSAPGAPCQQ